MDLITLLLAALATARITRLVTTDRITEAPRNRLLLRLKDDGLASYLITCDWCASVYIGAAVAGAGVWAQWWTWTMAIPAALAFSHVAGYLASKEG
jgi:hypothetical protein